jgi:hypothetical protein
MADSQRSDFTSGAEIPACLILGPLGDGRYYVDSDKQYDTENILSEYVGVSPLCDYLVQRPELIGRVSFWRNCS